MNRIKTISIIVPAYNASLSIAKCIESIIGQSYKNWILYIIDDGSNDDTESICKIYADKDERINYIFKENGGVSSARNLGISLVNTEYFVCIDSDDSVESDYLLELISLRNKFPKAGHIWCSFQTVSNQDKDNLVVHCIEKNSDVSIFDKKDYMILYNKWFTQMPWHKLYNTEIVKKNNIKMDENLSLGEDLLFNLEYLDVVNNSTIVISNKPCYNYVRVENDSLDHKFRSDLKDIFDKIHKSMYYYLNKWSVNEKSWDMYYDSCFYHYESLLKNTYHKDNKMTPRQKAIYNNAIISEESFVKVFSKRRCYINPLYYRAYKLKNYKLIRLLDWIVSKRGKK